MGTSPVAPEQASLEALRRQRADLRESMSAVEMALAGPARAGDARWTERVNVALVELSADFREHVAFTEGREGLYVDILTTAPRLSGAVAHLTEEHGEIKDQLDELLTLTSAGQQESADRLRGRGTALLGALVSHRQRGADLVYEAYELDLGGET
jgi:hypothetical protein